MLPLAFALFGLVVGSFLNVVILRHGERGIGGRSACPRCGTLLAWYDLVPVVSWIALRGRCRACHMRISIQYPLVEAATGVLFVFAGASDEPLFLMLLALPILALLECIFVYDLYHQLIPDAWVWPFIALALVFGAASAPPHFYAAELIAGPVAALPILFLWCLSKPFTGSAGQWMGFGDVKLALGIGWLLGFPLGLVAIFFAFVIGAIISVCVLLPLPHLLAAAGMRTGAGGAYTMKSEVPFGPFLIAGCLTLWFASLHGLVPLFLFG